MVGPIIQVVSTTMQVDTALTFGCNQSYMAYNQKGLDLIGGSV